jgi:hypothetical protein
MEKKIYFVLVSICFFVEHALLSQTLPLNVPLSREMVQRGQLSGIIPVKRSGNLWPASYRSMFSFDLGVNMDTVKNKFFSVFHIIFNPLLFLKLGLHYSQV